MGKVTRKRSSGKQVLEASSADEVYVGLDVHKRSIHVAVRINGQLVKSWVGSGRTEDLLKSLESLRPGLRSVVYEAGPSGFSLVRALRNDGFPGKVIDPGSTPKPSTRQNKTDGLDCRKLAEDEEKGLLKEVMVPSEEEEADRQVVRTRDQIVRKRRRVKQQIKCFLMQHGIAEPDGLKKWSKAGVNELKDMDLREQLRFALDLYLEELGDLDELIKSVDQKLREMSGLKRHAAAIAVLTSHPGVGPVTAMTYRTEIWSETRFQKTSEISRYTGLSPVVAQSGESRKELGISRTGRGQLRCVLIEAAWRWVDLDPGTRKVYGRLVSNTGSAKKAIVAMARKLAINLWRMLVTGEVYRPAA